MRKQKIHYRTMLNLVVVGNVLGAILVIGILIGTVYYRYMRNEVMNLMESNVEQAENYTSQYVENITNTGEKLAMDVELGIAVEAYFSPDINRSVEGKKLIDYIIQSALSMNSTIENIAIGTKDAVITQDRYSLDKNNRMEDIVEEAWYQALQRDEIKYIFTENVHYWNTAGEENYYLYATKFKNKFYQFRDQEERIVLITFHTAELEKYVDTISNNASIHLHILEPEGSSGAGKIIYESSGNPEIRSYLLGELSPKQEEKLRDNYVFFQMDSSHIGWQIVGTVSKRTLHKMIYKVEPWMVAAIGVVLLAAVAISTISSRMVSRPMKRLSQAMSDMEHSQFHGVEINTGCMELEQLMVTYNRMSRKIEELIEGIKQREEEKRRAEFQVLEAQINPHFIYNTLDAVKWVARINHSDKVGDLIESFVRLLRLSLSKGQEIIPVESEISLLQEYIKIMIFRNNYNINISYDIAPETRNLFTLKLVLQPFVENSFLHAFGEEKGEHCISIQSRCRNGVLVFEVIDNGKGFGVEERTQRGMTGIGIDNIDKRMKAWHGESYGVEIISEKDNGTRVIIRQPVMEKGEIHDTGNDC